jgi:rhamnulokinase
MEGIAVCGHDTASVVAAIPVTHPDYVFISAGTWCIVGVESDTPLLNEETFRRGFTNERGYDNRYRILKNIVGLWLLQGLKKHFSEVSSFGEMEQMARESEWGDLMIDPDDPGFYNPDDMKQAFDTYFRQSGQEIPENPGAYIHCAYRSLSFSFRSHIEILEKLSGRRFNVIHVVGGGSQSDYLNQFISDICDKPVIAGPVEAATIGNMLVQAVTMEKIADLDRGRSFVREHVPLKKYQPRTDPRKIIQQYQQYLSIKNH